MINEQELRTAALYGEDNLKSLKTKRIAVFGLGGVGSFVAEGLLRTGVGTIDVFDNDTVKPSNLNRQLVADTSTIGMNKTDAFLQRAKLINSDVKINTYNIFYLPENSADIDLSVYDFIVDAVDTVAAKVELILKANELNIPIISVMGTGNKTHPEMLTVTDIYKTRYCPLAKAVRIRLKKSGIKKLPVVFSPEIPKQSSLQLEQKQSGHPSPSSSIFVPATAGLLASSYVVNFLIKA